MNEMKYSEQLRTVCVVYRGWEIMTGTVTTVIGRALYWSAPSAGVFFTQRARTTTPNWRMTTHSSVLSARCEILLLRSLLQSWCKGKVDSLPVWSIGWVLISLAVAIEPVGG